MRKEKIGLVEFLEKARQTGLLPMSEGESVYHPENYDLALHLECLELLTASFGDICFECMVDLCIAGLGFEFRDEDDIRTFLYGGRLGRLSAGIEAKSKLAELAPEPQPRQN